MKTFIKHFAFVTLSLYLVICFISFTPNISTWESSGRGAFLFFAIIFSVVSTAIVESEVKKY